MPFTWNQGVKPRVGVSDPGDQHSLHSEVPTPTWRYLPRRGQLVMTNQPVQGAVGVAQVPDANVPVECAYLAGQ